VHSESTDRPPQRPNSGGDGGGSSSSSADCLLQDGLFIENSVQALTVTYNSRLLQATAARAVWPLTVLVN